VHEPLTYEGPRAWRAGTGMRVAEVAVRRGERSRAS
jgi:hypothetical protein